MLCGCSTRGVVWAAFDERFAGSFSVIVVQAIFDQLGGDYRGPQSVRMYIGRRMERREPRTQDSCLAVSFVDAALLRTSWRLLRTTVSWKLS